MMGWISRKIKGDRGADRTEQTPSPERDRRDVSAEVEQELRRVLTTVARLGYEVDVQTLRIVGHKREPEGKKGDTEA